MARIMVATLALGLAAALFGLAAGCGDADCRDGRECPQGETCTRKITEQAETIWRCE